MTASSCPQSGFISGIDSLRLRDRLRATRIERPEEIDAEVFRYLPGLPQYHARLLHRIDIRDTLAATRAFARDEALRRTCRQKARDFSRCRTGVRARSIREWNAIFESALLANNGMLALYLAPVALPAIAGILSGNG